MDPFSGLADDNDLSSVAVVRGAVVVDMLSGSSMKKLIH